MKVRDVIKMVESDGWKLTRTCGSRHRGMTKYAVFIEPTATGYSAYVPDLPGCVAAATTLEDTRQLIKEAIEFHIEGMRINGEMVPEPTRHVEQVEVSAV